MKRVIYLILFSVLILTSCTSIKQIGRLNMISNRNVNPSLHYQQLTTYSGASQRELRKSKSKTIEDAINQAVKKVPGGEFLMNVKLYIVDNSYYAVEGDVWGSENNESFRGFKIGDKITYKYYGKVKEATFYGFKDTDKCMIKDNTTEKVTEIKYDDITKVYQ